ncbi:MAG: arylsulfotransferase family protein, partial [Acidimicrobiales bacterium]
MRAPDGGVVDEPHASSGSDTAHSPEGRSPEGGSPEGGPPEERGLLHRRFHRRHLLIGAGAAVVLAGAGVGISEWVSSPPASSPDVDRFRSRPDLLPFETTLEVPADGVAPGYVFLTSGAGPGQRGPMIVDNEGRLVWFHRVLPAGHAATNLKVQQYRGRPVLTWWEGEIVIPQGYGKGEYVIADTSYREITRVRGAHGLHGDLHELVLTSGGTALFTAYRTERADLRSIGGPRRGQLLDSLIQEVDVASGNLLFEWDPRDHVALAESYASPSAIPANGGEYDFFHANSIDVEPDGTLLVSARHTWAVYKIDRKSGDIVWRLNGKRSDFDVAEDAQFQYQHDAIRAPDGSLTLFDDGSAPPDVAVRSRGLALSVDEARRKVTLLEEYLPDPRTLTTSQGSVQTLSNGNRFVGWGSQPYASEYA